MKAITARKWFTIVAVISVAVLMVDAQAPPPTNFPCIAELAACSAFYANATLTPTSECCTPLDNVYKTELPCLCQVFNSPAIQKALGIDLESGLELFKRCNITDASPAMCMAPPPAAPPKSSPAANGAVYGSHWIGFCGFFTLFVFIFSFMA